MMNSSDYNLLTFKAISTFITELAEIFSETNHSLKLYSRLLNKTTISHENAIKKNIEAFRIFCTKNRDAIVNKNYKLFTESKVEYSPKVYVDFNDIFKDSDNETSNVIWKHLLTISALVDPASKAKEILKNSKDSKEANFLSDILNKVEENVKPGANPLEAVSSIMSSGIFNDLLSGLNGGIQNGDLDLSKLMGTVQQMCSTLGGGDLSKMTEGAGGENPMNIINNMMSSLSTGGEGGQAPDLSNLTTLLGPMLSNLSGNNQNSIVPPTTIEEVNEIKAIKEE